MNINNNFFSENKALEGAGTVYWINSAGTMSEPIGLRTSNQFDNRNIAKYGSFW